MSNGKAAGEAIAAIALGFLGGLALAAILSMLVGLRCPTCNEKIIRGAFSCPHCRTALRWD